MKAINVTVSSGKPEVITPSFSDDTPVRFQTIK